MSDSASHDPPLNPDGDSDHESSPQDKPNESKESAMPPVCDETAPTHLSPESVQDEPTSDPPRKRKKPPRQSELPVTFGRYELRRVLGKGGMGIVYLAYDAKMKRDVALKIPTWTVGHERESERNRFLVEVHSTAKLRHPNICPVFDYGDIDGFDYFTMAFVHGPTLRKSQSELRAEPIRKRIDLIVQIAGALGHAHRKKVLHRDLKPENILLEGGTHPMVTDFGLAKQVDSELTLTAPGAPVGGSYGYISYEQAIGDVDNMGAWSDVVSLGAIFFELLTGQNPYGNDTELVRRLAHDEEIPLPSSINDDVDPDLDRICMKMLAQKIDDRYQSMSEVIAALTDYLHTKDAARPTFGRYGSLVGLIAVALTVVYAAFMLLPSPGNDAAVVTTPSPDSPEVHFVGIAVEDYGNGNIQVPGSTTQVVNLKEELQRQGLLSSETVLTNVDVTSERLEEAFRNLKAKTNTADTILIAVAAGHAWEQSNDGDAASAFEDNLYGAEARPVVSDTVLFEMLADLQGRRIIMIVDAVFPENSSGSINRRAPYLDEFDEHAESKRDTVQLILGTYIARYDVGADSSKVMLGAQSAIARTISWIQGAAPIDAFGKTDHPDVSTPRQWLNGMFVYPEISDSFDEWISIPRG